MAYDEELAGRVRRALAGRPAVTEIKMFGGLCFTLHGNMCCGIVGDELMVRAGPERYRATLSEPHVRPMDFTGRPLNGLVFVGPRGLKAAPALRKWVKRGVDFALSLPPKSG